MAEPTQKPTDHPGVRAWALTAAVAITLSLVLVCTAFEERWAWFAAALGVLATMVSALRARQHHLRGQRATAAVLTQAQGKSAMLAHVFASVLDPILAIDERGRILAANPAVTKVFGWTADELAGQNVNVLMGEPFRTEHDGYIAAYLATGAQKAIGRIRNVIGRRRDGDEFPCELSVSEVWIQEGRRFFGVVRDVSEREHVTMRMAAAERLAAVGELAAGIAHEVNNPINTIINCAQMIKEGDRAPELCDHVIQEGMRIASFVRELLDTAADREEAFQATDVRDPIQRALTLLAIRFRHAHIRFETDLPEGLPRVRAKPRRLQQVFLNLFLNARDALRSVERGDRCVQVAARRADDSPDLVEITVRDNGPGIPPHALSRIFQPFYTTKNAGEGTGLGLAVSAAIVHDHDGTLSARSEPGVGAEFVLRLPTAT